MKSLDNKFFSSVTSNFFFISKSYLLFLAKTHFISTLKMINDTRIYNTFLFSSMAWENSENQNFTVK